jgi:hypothetical protein
MWCNYCRKSLGYDREHRHVKECERNAGYTSLFSYVSCCMCFEILNPQNIAKQEQKQDICQECFGKEKICQPG